MSEEKKQNQTASTAGAGSTSPASSSKTETATSGRGRGGRTSQGGDRRPARRGGGRGRRNRERVKPEFEQKILNIRRVTRVVAGGRRFSFSVVLVIGNRKGVVGVGIGKAGDTSLAIQKAYNSAKKNLVRLDLTESSSIPYEIDAKYNSARVALMPNKGRGVVAGGALRTVVDLAGIKDVSGRILSRSKNHLNNARAMMKALEPFSRRYVPEKKKTTEGASENSQQSKQKENSIKESTKSGS